MSKLVAISMILLATATAVASPPPPPPEPEPERRPAIEWSTWIRLAYGVANHGDEPGVARVVSPPTEATRESGFEAALGIDLTAAIGAGGDRRLGLWAEARTSSLPVVGAELLIGALPAKLDMFFYDGEGVLVVRGGGNPEVVTASVAYGYRCPWDLWGPWRGATRYMIGVRVVATATRSIADPDDWAATLGLETEPAGALRYLLGIRSWY